MSKSQDDKEAINYGDVFNVSGDLANKPITPKEAAATVQGAETKMLGKTLKGGPPSVLQSAAEYNTGIGIVSHDDVAREQGVSFSQSEEDRTGNRIVTESIAGQVVGRYEAPIKKDRTSTMTESDQSGDTITIGEALEATALSLGDKPVDRQDAAAIQAAETRATGEGKTVSGGLAAAAQAAVVSNERTAVEEGKVTIADILTDAAEKLQGGDKAVTSEDAEAVVGAELRNSLVMKTTPGGVADSMSAGARLNEQF